MANLNESATWETGIFQIETTTPALGGPDGPVNTAPRQLANRTQYLKKQTDSLNAAVAAAAGSAGSIDCLSLGRTSGLADRGIFCCDFYPLVFYKTMGKKVSGESKGCDQLRGVHRQGSACHRGSRQSQGKRKSPL